MLTLILIVTIIGLEYEEYKNQRVDYGLRGDNYRNKWRSNDFVGVYPSLDINTVNILIHSLVLHV